MCCHTPQCICLTGACNASDQTPSEQNASCTSHCHYARVAQVPPNIIFTQFYHFYPFLGVFYPQPVYYATNVVTGRGFAEPPKLYTQDENQRQVNSYRQYENSHTEHREYDNSYTQYDSGHTKYVSWRTQYDSGSTWYDMSHEQLLRSISSNANRYRFNNKKRKAYSPPYVGGSRKESNIHYAGLPSGR